MAEFTIKDRKTGEILCQGSQKKCAEYVGCNAHYLNILSTKKSKSDAETKFHKYLVERHGEVKIGGARLRDVICCDCGVLMKNVGATRQRCEECQRKHHREHAKYQKREARNSYPVCSKIRNPNKFGCEGCVYFYADFEVNKCCNYIFIKGKRRPCPPGNECTEKIERKGYHEKEK